ncbi:hypothetical protein BDR05DRAFT_952085 [Suillus weaverae]|nr:hypothetical protein BDR05DRAFT_952085 [Suillus weaverae]
MGVEIDDPQTYNWHCWAKEQQIPATIDQVIHLDLLALYWKSVIWIIKMLKLTEEYLEKNHTTSLVETAVPALDLTTLFLQKPKKSSFSLTSTRQRQASTMKESAIHSVLSTNKHLQENFSLEGKTTIADPPGEYKKSLFTPSTTSQPQDTSLSITSGSSASDELDRPSQTTCKISKGTLIFSCAKNQVDLGFDFESVTLVPSMLKSKSKKGKDKSLQSPKKRQIIQTKEQSKGTKEISKSSLISQPKSKAVEISAHKSKEKAKTQDEISKSSSKLPSKSQAAETISANLSKVAWTCQTSSNQDELQWNDKFVRFFSYLERDWKTDGLKPDIQLQVSKIMAFKDVEKQVKISMHTIIKYVYWMKNKDRMSVLDEDAKSGFKVLFDLLKISDPLPLCTNMMAMDKSRACCTCHHNAVQIAIDTNQRVIDYNQYSGQRAFANILWAQSNWGHPDPNLLSNLKAKNVCDVPTDDITDKPDALPT